MKQGDLEPDLIVDITGSGGDLNDVMSWRMTGQLRGAAEPVFVDDSPVVVVDPEDPTKAAVTHTWVEGETDTAGVLLVEVKGYWSVMERPQTFPTSGYAQVRISDDLD